MGHTAENHWWLLDAPALSGEAVSVPRKASASSNASVLFSEWFIALVTQFSPSDPTEPDSHHQGSILLGSQPIPLPDH